MLLPSTAKKKLQFVHLMKQEFEIENFYFAGRI